MLTGILARQMGGGRAAQGVAALAALAEAKSDFATLYGGSTEGASGHTGRITPPSKIGYFYQLLAMIGWNPDTIFARGFTIAEMLKLARSSCADRARCKVADSSLPTGCSRSNSMSNAAGRTVASPRSSIGKQGLFLFLFYLT